MEKFFVEEGGKPLFFGGNIENLKSWVLNDVEKDLLADDVLEAYNFGDEVTIVDGQVDEAYALTQDKGCEIGYRGDIPQKAKSPRPRM